MELNPRNLRDKLAPFVGKKVMIGTSDWHYISGIFEQIEGTELRIMIAGKPITLEASKVATIKEAPALQSEYVK